MFLIGHYALAIVFFINFFTYVAKVFFSHGNDCLKLFVDMSATSI